MSGIEEIGRLSVDVDCPSSDFCRLKARLESEKATCYADITLIEKKDGISTEVVVRGDRGCEKLMEEVAKNLKNCEL